MLMIASILYSSMSFVSNLGSSVVGYKRLLRSPFASWFCIWNSSNGGMHVIQCMGASLPLLGHFCGQNLQHLL